MRRIMCEVALTGFVLFMAASMAAAQTTGSIRGTVTDDTGAVLPGATVTIYSDAVIGRSRTDVTNSIGVYRFPALSVGTYAVEVSMDGFETERHENVQVELNSTATVNAALKLASVAETVTVIGESPIVDVASSTSRTSFKNELVEDLPTNRNFYDYIQLAPGMSAVFSGGTSDRTVAFGSNQQSNSWNIDGIETSAPETGSSWWSLNPDMIEEVEIIGVGAPAEFGNATGGVFNVVTKKGGDTFSGGANFFWQHDDLTEENARLFDIPYTRDIYRNLTAQLGGPIVRDRAWFFGGFSYFRDAEWQPGNDPADATSDLSRNDMYDIKTTFRLGNNHELGALFHYEDWGFIGGSTPFIAPSAAFVERGHTYAWGGNLTSTLSPDTLFAARYAGWWSDDIHDSPTGSLEQPFADYTPPGGGPPVYTGGVIYPWDYTTWSQQFNAKVTHYTEDFLASQHEFKFGVQFSRGHALTNVAAGPDSAYTYSYYGYLYQVIQYPYQYGGETRDVGIFVDDTINIGERATLNLGVRFDLNDGWIPDYNRLVPGTPSIAIALNALETDQTVAGVPDFINWNLISPRLGATVQLDDEGRSVLKGYFGIMYDQNVIGNWDAPSPALTPYQIFAQNPATGEFDSLVFEIQPEDVAFHPDLRPPKSQHYTIGFEQQIGANMAAGIEYVHKYTDDLIGWEIVDGVYEPFPFTDPFTGESQTLLNEVVKPTLRKGNSPGNFPGAPDKYEQEYDGIVLTLEKRMSNSWSLMGSYTFSESDGLIPAPWFQGQNNPFYGDTVGQDPNAYLNAFQRLQGDRPHMFRIQGVFHLPWDFMVSPSINVESGKPFPRQIQVFGLNQTARYVILEPAGSRDALRHEPNKLIDLAIGKRVHVGEAELIFDARIYNLLNDDAVTFLADTRLQTPEDTFVPDSWVLPRRLMIKLGLRF